MPSEKDIEILNHKFNLELYAAAELHHLRSFLEQWNNRVEALENIPHHSTSETLNEYTNQAAIHEGTFEDNKKLVEEIYSAEKKVLEAKNKLAESEDSLKFGSYGHILVELLALGVIGGTGIVCVLKGMSLMLFVPGSAQFLLVIGGVLIFSAVTVVIMSEVMSWFSRADQKKTIEQEKSDLTFLEKDFTTIAQKCSEKLNTATSNESLGEPDAPPVHNNALNFRANRTDGAAQTSDMSNQNDQQNQPK